jgi:hypothetical protein
VYIAVGYLFCIRIRYPHACFMQLTCLRLPRCRSATTFEDIIENKQLLQVGLPTLQHQPHRDADVAVTTK